ncbi:hypothetical protein TWF506_008551 [Arthrobotrys conoides]|uniref:Uncharacterized protein n=1 Tax=Arthrobotrys conoides TaxID=74498 RepID=A0AAN8RMT5_9PEZI
MVSTPFRYEETRYEFSSTDPEYIYADTSYPAYAFNQSFFPKTCSNNSSSSSSSIPFEPFSNNMYPSWAELTTDGSYLADHQIIQEQYASGYAYNATAMIYMAKYHAMEYEFNTGLPNNVGILPDFAIECLLSDCGSTNIPSYPPITWSPSEPSVASLSPPYDVYLEKKDLAARAESLLGDEANEVLQGLGLYDCPELATDHGSLDELHASYLGLGKGLKLEESFEFREEYSDDEEDEEDEEQSDEN